MGCYGGSKEYSKIFNEEKGNKPIITTKEIKYYEALLEVFKKSINGENVKVKKK